MSSASPASPEQPAPTPYRGSGKADRTGTRSLFGRQIRYDLSAGFPLITTNKVHPASLESLVGELLRTGDENSVEGYDPHPGIKPPVAV
jgi:thymidylate synthase